MTAPAASIGSVAIVGAGYMGTGIAQVLTLAGVRCRIYDIDRAHTEAAHDACLKLARSYERRRYFPAGAAATIEHHLRPASCLADAVGDVELVIEAVTEDLEVKRAALSAVEALVRVETILASNTSSIPIASLAAGLRRPQQMYGIHWFNPAQFLPSVEIIEAPGASAADTCRVLELLRRAAREATVVPDAPGFVANRLQFALFREAALMVEEGLVEPEQVDQVVRGSFGYRLPFFGPFEIADIAGLDVYAAIFDVLESSLGERFSCPPSLRARVASGRLGLKSGEGYRHYTDQERTEVADRRDSGYLSMAHALASWREGRRS